MSLPLPPFAKVFQNGSLVDANQDLNPWVASHNEIITELNQLGGNVQTLSTTAQALSVVPRADSLTVDVIGGLVKLTNGNIVSVPATALVIPATSTRFIWVDDVTGAVAQGAAYPVLGWRIARIVSDATRVTLVENEPTRVIQPAIDFDRRVLIARKTSVQNLTGGTPQTISGWQTVYNELGAAWNPSTGVWTMAANTTFRAEVDVRITNNQPNASLTAKLSLYAGADELKILDELSTFADSNGAIWKLGGWFSVAKGATLPTGAQISARVQLRAGTTGVINADQNTELTIFRL